MREMFLGCRTSHPSGNSWRIPWLWASRREVQGHRCAPFSYPDALHYPWNLSFPSIGINRDYFFVILFLRSPPRVFCLWFRSRSSYGGILHSPSSHLLKYCVFHSIVFRFYFLWVSFRQSFSLCVCLRPLSSLSTRLLLGFTCTRATH